MSENDRFMEQLRASASQLRYEPRDPDTFSRLSRRISLDLEKRSGTELLLARWLKPLSFALMTVIVLALTTLALPPLETTDQLARIAEASLLQEDFYRGIQ